MPTFFFFLVRKFFFDFPFLRSEGLFSPFWPPKVYFFLLHVNFPIDGYVSRSYWFWSPNSVFGLWTHFRFFDPQKFIFCLLHLNSWSMDKSHDHTDFGAQIRFLGSEGLFSFFWPPKSISFLLHVKFTIDGLFTRSYWCSNPNSVLGSEGLFTIFWPPKSIFFLLHVKFSIDGYVTRSYWFWALGPTFAFLTLFAENIKKSVVKKDTCEKLFKDLCWIYVFVSVVLLIVLTLIWPSKIKKMR
jgi:hypothetical protein